MIQPSLRKRARDFAQFLDLEDWTITLLEMPEALLAKLCFLQEGDHVLAATFPSVGSREASIAFAAEAPDGRQATLAHEFGHVLLEEVGVYAAMNSLAAALDARHEDDPQVLRATVMLSENLHALCDRLERFLSNTTKVLPRPVTTDSMAGEERSC